MKKSSRTIYLAFLLFVSSFGLMVTVELKDVIGRRIFSAVSSKISELKQNNMVAFAHIHIEHTCYGDLVVDLGVGDPDNPDWFMNIWNKGEADNLNLTIDISEATQYLPPSESNRWFLKVYDAANEDIGQIAAFTVNYHNETYASTCISVPIYDIQTSFSYIPGVPLELAISRRISIRDFPDTENYTLPEVSWKLLSKVLWAGYGHSSWGRTVPSICGNYPLVVYVCNKTAAYRYNPQEQSLDLWKKGDYRFSPEKWDRHRAPIELFITLDSNECADIYLGAMEAGCIIQNVYLEANSLGLGTVCVGGVDREAVHNDLDLPANEYVLYNMPLGHPESKAFYNFSSIDVAYPPGSSELPQVKQSSIFLDYALMERNTAHNWRETPLTSQEISQILWAAYGFSYLKDIRPSFWSFQRQHRTVPSAHGRYPLTIWMANSTGVYVYDPWLHRTSMKIEGDKRAEIAEATGANWMVSAPTMLVVVWNSSSLDQQQSYTEVGLVVQNVHLESVAWDLVADSAKIVDEDPVKAVLGLVQQTDLHPVTVITVGHPIATPVHDVAVVSVVPSSNEVVKGDSINVTVVVENKGTESETFNVTAYANTTIIQTLTVSDLAPANQTTLTFLWNTTGASLGNYTISAEASVVPGEIHATNNVKVNDTVNVIPEFASILLLFIAFLATTIVTIFIKKRLSEKGAQRHSSIKISGYDSESLSRYVHFA